MQEITIVLAILMFLTTVIYVYYTGQLLNETIALRKVESSPFIGANIQIKQGFSFIMIKNIGKAPAYNVNINLEESIFEDIKIMESAISYTEVNYFGVNQEISIPFDTRKFVELKKTIALDLNYQSKDKDTFKDIKKELQEIVKVVK